MHQRIKLVDARGGVVKRNQKIRLPPCQPRMLEIGWGSTVMGKYSIAPIEQ